MTQKKINIQNKKARFEFELIDQYTAGMVLTDELKQKVNALPMKEEIESMITKPEASPESLLDPTEEQ